MADLHPGVPERIPRRPPFGVKWRSSYLFTTFTVTLGITTDLLVYTIIVPVMPFHLEQLGYNNVSARTGWLLFAYSAGLVLSNIPIAVFSERYGNRKWPLIIGLLVLACSQVMLMEAPTYAIMCVARFIQGIASAVIWVVGLALICDATPSTLIGTHLGIAMSGLSIGSLVGPPVGGALFTRFGFRGPFVLTIAWTIIDLIARLLIIERKVALKWGIDPHNPSRAQLSVDRDHETLETSSAGLNVSLSPVADEVQKLSLPAVLFRLCKSSRALTAFFLAFAYGITYTSQEPTLPLHLQDIWALNSAKVGLVFLASVIPTLFSSPLTGRFCDKNGSEWVTFTCIVLALPWILVMIIQGPLALFIVAYALEMFFTSGVISPITTELARVAEGINGVGYAHTYAVFNIAYGMGSAAGPIIGGQIYDRLPRGWMAICFVNAALMAVGMLIATFYTGADPLANRILRKRRISSDNL